MYHRKKKRKKNFCIKFMFSQGIKQTFYSRTYISFHFSSSKSFEAKEKKHEINSWAKFERVITSDNVGSLLNRTLIRKRSDNDEKREKKKRGLKRSGGLRSETRETRAEQL